MFDDDQNVDSIFGVFDGQTTNIDDFDDHVSDEEAATTNSTTKRQRDEELEGKETLKRHRLEDVQAIVADTFEQETSREVANIAGLQNAPAAEGEQITLSHQVKLKNSIGQSASSYCQCLFILGSPSSCCSTQLQLCPYFSACSPQRSCTCLSFHA